MKTIIALTAALLVTGCANNKNLDKQLDTLEGHVEKSSTLRGTFCNGEGYKWYYEGRNAVMGTCANGLVFHLPLED
jgi:hypothetical protein